MKKVYRKLGWLLLVAMLVGVFATGVAAAEPGTGTQSATPVAIGTPIKLVWDGTAPAEVTEVKLNLYLGENKINGDTPYTFTKDENDLWQIQIPDLALKDATGAEITYGVELATEGLAYTAVAVAEQDVLEITMTPKNVTPAPVGEPGSVPSAAPGAEPGTGGTATPDTVTMTATVVWDDSSNQDGVRPAELKIQLYNGETATGDPVTVQEDADGKWVHSYTELAKDGTWSVKAVAEPEGYTVNAAADEGGNYVITCTHTPATVEYKVSATWNDGNDQLKQRPSSVKVQLYQVVPSAEGNKRVDVGTPVELSGDNQWTYTFTNLPKFAAGSALTYRFALVETPSKYTASYDFSAGAVKLTNDYKNNTTMDYKVTAKWVDNNNKYNKRPSSMSVTLYADGKKSQTATMKPDASGNWNYTFQGIADYKDGKKVSYEIKITAVSNYVSKVKYTTSNGVTTATITNTYSDIPLTGDSTNLYLWITLVAAAALALGGVTGIWFRKIRM